MAKKPTTTPKNDANDGGGNAPVATRRIGNIRGSIWARDGQYGPTYSTSFDRSYRDRDGNWGHTYSFDRDDLLVLAKVADWCHTWIVRKQEQDRQAQNGQGD